MEMKKMNLDTAYRYEVQLIKTSTLHPFLKKELRHLAREHTFWSEQAFTDSDNLSRNKACAFFNNSTGLAFLAAE